MNYRFVIIIVLLVIAEYYSFVVLKTSVRNLSAGWRTGITIGYLAFTVLNWLSIFLFRAINWSALPHEARNIYIAVMMGFFVGKLLILLVMLVDELRRLILWVVSFFAKPVTAKVVATNGITRSDFLVKLALALGGSAIVGFIYGLSNRYDYKIRHVKLNFPNLPESFKGLKVVQLSDIHSGSFDNPAAVAKGVQKVLDEKPDLILFTGDLVNNKADEMEDYISIFSRLKAPMGVYSTLGNHDYGDYVQWENAQAKRQNLQNLMDTHAKMGWRLMMDEHTIFTRGADKIALIGIQNWGAKANFPKYGDLGKATAGMDEKVPFKILMSHDPSHWDAQVRHEFPDIDLTLSGHTHGMQFGIEIPGFKWSPVKYMYKEWAGLYNEGRQYIYVNRGFGFLGYPGRIGILPEITVLEFV